MKKLLLVLLVVTIASFLFVGCLPTTPAEGEGEGEGEGECETTVVIDGAVVVDGKTYVSCGDHDITVTFCAPVDGSVFVYITDCNGYYGKDSGDVVMFPDATKTVWTGSGYFGGEGGCCASYVQVESGECLADVCIEFPVIVDGDAPFALIDIGVEDCTCEGCMITFDSIINPVDCAADEECCGDDCSGLASWSVVLYDGDPFDECCDPSICEEPIGSCSGTACPIECTTECLDAGTYYAVVTLVDNVGLEEIYYAEIVLSGDGSSEDCSIEVTEGFYDGPPDCVVFDGDTDGTIGACYDECLD